MTDPAASSTAWLTKFSEAISSRPLFWRWRSSRIAAAISGSDSVSVRHRRGVSVFVVMMSLSKVDGVSGAGPLRTFNLGNLFDPALMPAAGECRLQPEGQDLVG